MTDEAMLDILGSMSPFFDQLEPLAWRAFNKHTSLHTLEHYTGILCLHGLARLAVRTDRSEYLEEVRKRLEAFWQGRAKWGANFPNYFCGGNASAYLYAKGRLPEAKDAILQRAAEQDKQPRNRVGLFSMPKHAPDSQHIWIDTIFAVTPFYLYAGLAFEREEWIDEAVDQALGHYAALLNRETGLLHQSYNFAGPGKLSDDHWSRGNGWGLHAMAALILDLPTEHRRRREVEEMYLAHISASIRFQSPNGLWFQEMSDSKSYIETSGSYLILQGLGAGLEKGLLGSEYREALQKGLQAGMEYITPDGSMFHCCQGCLCPGDGSKQAYAARSAVLNDPHAFGPVIHACEQAMGVFGDLGSK